jgi:hypothetical protein
VSVRVSLSGFLGNADGGLSWTQIIDSLLAVLVFGLIRLVWSLDSFVTLSGPVVSKPMLVTVLIRPH